MNYIIHTPSAARLKKEILDRVSEKVDANGKGIVTWQIAETDGGERVLVHTRDQWAEKGGIVLGQVSGRNNSKQGSAIGNPVTTEIMMMTK